MKVAVYGSCVSRDVVRVAEEQLELERYYARSSWISTTTEPVALPTQPSKLSSAFQQRMVEYDLQSRALSGVVAAECQTIMLDLVDERLGVYPVNHGGYVTWLNELNYSGWLPAIPHGKLVEFGSDAHFKLFAESAPRVADALSDKRSILLKFNFAAKSIEGQVVPEANSRSAAWWNEAYARYYDAACSAGIEVLEVPAELCLSTTSHRWGIAQYHYQDEFYFWIAEQLTNVTENPREVLDFPFGSLD